MCYYNSVKVKTHDLSFVTDENNQVKDLVVALQSGFEFSSWPVVLDKKAVTIATPAHWEFIPFYYRTMEEVKAARKKYTTLNAKGETLLKSKVYQQAALERRCLVLSSGFYEWRHYNGKTYPYHIKVEGLQLFFIAGVWQPWTDKETGETLDTFALITTEANELMTEVHNNKKRMPTILNGETAQAWLSPDLSEQEIAKLAIYHTSDKLEAYTLRKDFTKAPDPTEPFVYPELPALQVA